MNRLKHNSSRLSKSVFGNNFRERGVVGKFPYTGKGVDRSSKVINHGQKDPRADAVTLWNSSGDRGKVRETIRAKLYTLGCAPLGSAPLGSVPLGSAPLGSAPVGSAPLGSAPLGSARWDLPRLDLSAGICPSKNPIMEEVEIELDHQ